MKKYVLTSTRFKGNITFHYNMTGQLVYFDNQAALDHKGNAWLLRNLPLDIMALLRIKTKVEGSLTEVK